MSHTASPAPAVSIDIILDLVNRVGTRHPALRSRAERAAQLLVTRVIEEVPTNPVPDCAVGGWLVQSASNPAGFYTVAPGSEHTEIPGLCTCPDQPRAPLGWCKHRLAVAMLIRARELAAEPAPVTRWRTAQPEPRRISRDELLGPRAS